MYKHNCKKICYFIADANFESPVLIAISNHWSFSNKEESGLMVVESMRIVTG